MSDAVDFHDELASRWEAKYCKSSFARREEILDLALRGIDLSGQRWLDAGCGTGRLARALARRGAHVIGIDGSAQMIRVARELAVRENFTGEQLGFEQLDITRIATLGGSFHGVLCNSVIEYLDQPDATVASLAASLELNGVLLISAPNRRSILRRTLQTTHRLTGWPAYLKLSKNEYTRDEFVAVLEHNRMRIEQVMYFGGPVPRWMQRSRFVGSLCMFVARRGPVT